MTVPVAAFVVILARDPTLLERVVWRVLFSGELAFERAIMVAGLAIFVAALAQLLKMRGRLVTSGLYAVVRHPQYLGLILATWGLSAMCVRYVPQPDVIGAWPIQAAGYVLLAGCEERWLLEECGDAYRKYKEEVPFIFPLPRLPERLERVITVVLLSTLAALLVLLPGVLVSLG